MVYFDNAATTFPKPAAVTRAVQQAVTVYGGNAGRSGHAISMKTAQMIFEVRRELADFFHTDVEQVIFTYNCTMSLNMAIKGVLAGGGHAVCSILDHNSVLRPLHALAGHPSHSFTAVPVYEGDEEATLKGFESAIRPDTKAIVCTHGSNVNGVILPIKALGELAHRHGLLFIVDAAQSAGVLPIDMDRLRIDILCTAGHKGLYGITGTGLMILRSGLTIPTLLEGGTGSASIRLDQPEFLPDRFESGTVGSVGVASLGAGLRFLKSRGLQTIYRHEMRLSKKLWRFCRDCSGISTVNKTFETDTHLPVVSFAIEGVSSVEAVERLSERGFALRGGLHCAPLAHQMMGTTENGLIRFSPSAFSTEESVDRLIYTLSVMTGK